MPPTWPSSAAGERETDGEAATRARLALQREGAAVGEHDGAGDGEAESGPAGLPRARGIQAHEGLEDARLVGAGDPDAGVLHHEQCVALAARQRQLDLAAGGGGGRSSWAASAGNRRISVKAAARRASMPFSVSARRSSSSPVPRSAMR